MSYRAFKRLLGETSLERKCRFLFGGFILLLITGSFWLYARQTEDLAYDQLKTTGRLLLNQIMAQHIHTVCLRKEQSTNEEQKKVLDEFRTSWEAHWPEALREYKYQIVQPKSSKAEYQPK